MSFTLPVVIGRGHLWQDPRTARPVGTAEPGNRDEDAVEKPEWCGKNPRAAERGGVTASPAEQGTHQTQVRQSKAQSDYRTTKPLAHPCQISFNSVF